MDKSYDNFKTYHKKMTAHNDGDVPFKLGINKFSDLTEQEFSD
jgi:hypothetical protein